jgi:hypothetical protein
MSLTPVTTPLKQGTSTDSTSQAYELISQILLFIIIFKNLFGFLWQASLTIVMKPELSHEPEVRVEYYEETNIEVKVTAHPKSKVKW